ncbi:HAD family hydrolase [Methylobacillus arboreus]|uniref:HAD family hydrolase n=1 Tax=Methylobacillus arboreus TaxID=755170 RepID=UPI002E1AFFCA
MQSTGLAPHFIAAITPMDCGHWKPAPEIFLAALNIIKVKAENCLMIGDDPIRDVQPARALNMATLLINHQTSQTAFLDVLASLNLSIELVRD